jgi:hypothetical protein
LEVPNRTRLVYTQMLRKLLSFSLLFAGAATADTLILQFEALPNVHMSPTYATTTGAVTFNGYSTVTIGGIPSESLVCDDFTDSTNMPSAPLLFDYSTLIPNTPSYLAHVKYNAGSANDVLQRYEEAAVLMVNFTVYMAGGLTNPQTITDYNYAIWHVFNAAVPQTPGSTTPFSPSSAALEAIAINTVQNDAPTMLADANRLIIYTPNAANPANQEFLGIDTSTPEPGTLGLFTAMVCAGTAVRRLVRR